MQITPSALGVEHIQTYWHYKCSLSRVKGPASPSREEFEHEVILEGSSSLVLLFVLWLIEAINMLSLHICLHIKDMQFS